MFTYTLSFIPVMDEGLLITLSTTSYIAIIVFFLFGLYSLFSAQRKEAILLGKKKPPKFNPQQNMIVAKELRRDLYTLLEQKSQEHMLDITLGGIAFSIIGSFIFLLVMEQPILAIFFPFVLYKFIHQVVLMSTTQLSENIEEELPLAIDHMVRVASKTDSLKTIFFESSKRLDGPLAQIFEDIALKLSTVDTETLLLNFSNQYDNIWIYNFTFTVINFTKNTDKASVINNLIELRDMLEAENQEKKIQKTERKYAVMLNYTVAVAALVAFFANLIFNPIAKSFFFGSVVGLGCLIAGFGTLFATIIININLVKSKRKK